MPTMSLAGAAAGCLQRGRFAFSGGRGQSVSEHLACLQFTCGYAQVTKATAS